MSTVKDLILAMVLTFTLVLLLGCGNGEAATTPGSQINPVNSSSAAAPGATTVESGQPVLDTGPAPQPVSPMQIESGASSAPTYRGNVAAQPIPGSGGLSELPSLQTASAQSGIWVTGEGSITLEPDLSLVNIGVETTAKTVAKARDEAATAMYSIVQAVKAHGLTELDVQTQSFNIWPMYDYPEVIERGVRVRKQIVTGYRVNNSAAIKIRDLSKVGIIIDDVATAGGNATRINGISFTREDPKPFLTGLREAAVNDALAKAQHFATLTGVQVGPLMYIAEIGRGTPVARSFGDMEIASARTMAAPQTSISGGELELKLNVQAVFSIQ